MAPGLRLQHVTMADLRVCLLGEDQPCYIIFNLFPIIWHMPRTTAAMNGKKLCEACTKILSAQGDRDGIRLTSDAPHHADAESLRRALQLPCYLCCFAWAKPFEPTLRDDNIPDGSKYYFGLDYTGAIPLVNGLRFKLHPEGVYPLKLEPWQNMEKFAFPGLLSTNTGSASALDFLMRKYKECIDKHRDCGSQRNEHWLPSRILDVGTLGDEKVYLRTTHSFPYRGRYFCLSHCWGKSRPLTLTQETAQRLEHGIPLELLPKTFHDAVIVTRTSGTRFLWIDSLCIYQDNLDDWATEASRMRDVYSNASCTIAAAAAGSSDEGLFFERDPWLVRPRCLTATWAPEDYPEHERGANYLPAGQYWCDHDGLWMDCIEYAPLNKRGWVFQERHLSRRIMHFAGNQLFWECFECKASENYPSSLPLWATLRESDATSLKQKTHKLRKQMIGSPQRINSKELDDLYLDWIEWREEYSRSSVTKDEDKLVAIQGIAQDVGSLFDDELILGMWKSRILQDLCFSSNPDTGGTMRPPLQKLPAPSWSWASTNQRIMYEGTAGTNHQGTYVAKVSSLDLSEDAFRGSRWAILWIYCNLIRVIPKWEIPSWDNPSTTEAFKLEYGDGPVSSLRGFTMAKTGYSVDCGNEGMWTDDIFVDPKDRSLDVYMLVIRRFPPVNRKNGQTLSETAEGLWLTRRPVPEQAFERIGFFEIWGDECRQLLHEHNVSNNQIIALV